MQLEAAQREVRTTQGRAESATHELGAKLRQQRRQWAKEKAALKQAEALGLGLGLGLGLRTHGGGLTLTLTLTLTLALALSLTLSRRRRRAGAWWRRCATSSRGCAASARRRCRWRARGSA